MCEKESVEKGKGCMYRMCTSNGERVVLFWSDNVRTPHTALAAIYLLGM